MKKTRKSYAYIVMLVVYFQLMTLTWGATTPTMSMKTEELKNNVAIDITANNISETATAMELGFEVSGTVTLDQMDWSSELDAVYKKVDITNQGNNRQYVTIYLVGNKVGETVTPIYRGDGSLSIGKLFVDATGKVDVTSNSGNIKVIKEDNTPVVYDRVTIQQSNTGDGNSGGSGGSSTTDRPTDKPINKPEEIVKPEVIVEVNLTDIVGHWASEPITRMAQKGYIGGYADHTFRPNANITRAEFASILTRVFTFDAKEPLLSPFNDVKITDWYSEPVLLLYQNKITGGRSITEFAPNAPTTNEEIASLMVRSLKAKGIVLPKVREYIPFVDSDKISAFAKEDIQYLYEAGILSGFPGGQFAPKASSTRAQVAAIFDRVLTVIEDIK